MLKNVKLIFVFIGQHKFLGQRFQNNLSCIYIYNVDPKYIFGASLVEILVSILDTWAASLQQTVFFILKHVKSECQGNGLYTKS